VRRFSWAAHGQCRSPSVGLQRARMEFEANTSFAAAIEKVREHYGVAVSQSAVCAGTSLVKTLPVRPVL
jgi:hypothetical protein